MIPVYEAGEIEGTLYLLMRWVDGTDLRTLLRSSGRLSPSAHCGCCGRSPRRWRPPTARGLVHRDIKPANVLIAGGETRSTST